MDILKFNISGQNAFFRSNEVNDGDMVFSYGHIHKVALLGMLGAILGLNGHSQAYMLNEKYIHPEFYELLREVEVSIVPRADFGFFERKLYNMVNGCGYSINRVTKKGQSLMYNEQWLEEPSWDVYLKLDSVSDLDLRNKLLTYMECGCAEFIPCLGKNNHPAIISDVCVLKGVKCKNDVEKIDSLFVANNVSKRDVDYSAKFTFNDMDEEILDLFEYKEMLPIGYENDSCYHKKELLMFTNKKLDIPRETNLILVDNRNLYFF